MHSRDTKAICCTLLFQFCAAFCLGEDVHDVPAGATFQVAQTKAKRNVALVSKEKDGDEAASLVFQYAGKTWKGEATFTNKTSPVQPAATGAPVRVHNIAYKAATFEGQSVVGFDELHAFIHDDATKSGDVKELKLQFDGCGDVNLSLVKPAALSFVALLKWAPKITVRCASAELDVNPSTPGSVLRSIFAIFETSDDDTARKKAAHAKAEKALSEALERTRWGFAKEPDVVHSKECGVEPQRCCMSRRIGSNG